MTAASPDSALFKAQQAFGQALRDPQNSQLPDGVSARRMAVYHELFFNNFVSCLESAFPVMHEVLPRALTDRLVETFFRTHQSTTPEFSRLPREFVVWLENHGDDELPAYLYELAMWEWTELDVALDEAAVNLVNTDCSDWLDRSIEVNPTLRLLMFDYPVHRISRQFIPDMPDPQPVYLAAYRTTNDAIEFMTLQAGSAVFLQLMIDNPAQTGRELLDALLSALGQPPGEAMTQFASGFVQELIQRQIITALN